LERIITLLKYRKDGRAALLPFYLLTMRYQVNAKIVKDGEEIKVSFSSESMKDALKECSEIFKGLSVLYIEYIPLEMSDRKEEY
jgi:hypothetical protein